MAEKPLYIKLFTSYFLLLTNASGTRAIAAKYNLSVAPVSSNAVANNLATAGVDVEVSPNRSPSIRQINAIHQQPSFKETIGEAIENALINSKNLIQYASNLYDNGSRS